MVTPLEQGWIQVLHDRTVWSALDAVVQFLRGLPATFLEFSCGIAEELDYVDDND